MAKIKLSDGQFISDYEKPYIVAELNTSHFGNIDTAKAMISEAKKAGCDCVKFQSWTENTLYSKSYYEKNPIAKRFVKGFSFSESQLKILAKYSKDCDIAFASTPYSNSEVDFLLDECDAPYIKIASMDINNYTFLEYIAKTDSPIVLSTGMSDLEEIHNAINIIEKAGNNKICILHCISIYPTEMEAIHLNNIIGLREAFPNYPIGFSDHSLGIEISSAAIVLGACMIEKHFTLDKTKIGMDNQMAIEPNEMSALVENCNNIKKSLGNKKRVVSKYELDQRKLMRRSIISKKDLKAGTKLTLDDLDTKRPGTGLPPEMIDELVGKVLVNDIDCDMLLNKDDFSDD
tara:strand:- start:715 stop:1752 length:1038 start_codon:yes stop_codon:yes gene_type:complete